MPTIKLAVAARFVRGMLILVLLTCPLGGPGNCNEPPPCTDSPNSFMGGADGYVYRDYSTGRMLSDRTDICINTDGEVRYYSNTDDMQTIIVYDTIDGIDVITIYYADYREPYSNADGMIMMTTQSAAEYSNANDWPIPLDGKYAMAWIFIDTMDDKNPQPTHMSSGGELTFPSFSYVTGAPIKIRYNGTLEKYSEQPQVLTSYSLPKVAPELIMARIKTALGR